MNNESNYVLIISTFSDDENGRTIIDSLLEKRIAACIQVLPIQSYYRWQGKIQADNEKLMLIKTLVKHYPSVESEIVRLHAYDTPEVIRLGIDEGFESYLKWIDAEC